MGLWGKKYYGGRKEEKGGINLPRGKKYEGREKCFLHKRNRAVF